MSNDYDELCPISYEKIRYKFTLNCGHTYEYESIYEWIYMHSGKCCPLCRTALSSYDMILLKVIDAGYVYKQLKSTNVYSYLKHVAIDLIYKCFLMVSGNPVVYIGLMCELILRSRQ